MRGGGVRPYDTRGRKIGMTDPDMGNWNYAYDAYSRIYTQTGPTGFAVQNNYNANGYLTQVVMPSLPLRSTGQPTPWMRQAIRRKYERYMTINNPANLKGHNVASRP